MENIENSAPAAVPAALQEFFAKNPKVALAFSGGADSAYLLYAAKACGADLTAYYVSTQFQPAFEKRDAEKLAGQLEVPLVVLTPDILADKTVAANPPDRCYHCKHQIFAAIQKQAKKDGYPLVIDGTNASDDAGDRPGMRALKERDVRSPLQECGITKDRMRDYSRRAKIFTWNKPAYACLATRVPYGTPLTAAVLEKIEKAEHALFKMGFSDLRVRIFDQGKGAKIQLPAGQIGQAAGSTESILEALDPYFEEILLDLRPRP